MTTATPSAFALIGQLASQRRLHAAFAWLHLHEQQIMRWQSECVAIPAPPFAESRRALWIAERFRELGLSRVHIDAAGNVLGSLEPSTAESFAEETSQLSLPADSPAARGGVPQPGAENNGRDISGSEWHESSATSSAPPADRGTIPADEPVLLLSAHIDTVFPFETPLSPKIDGSRLEAPGACDNGAGLAALFAVAAALRHAGIQPSCRLVFLGNVGEEGEGDLRGVRHIYAEAHWRQAIVAHLVLDGAGQNVAVNGALGSRRFEVTLEGAGGHSWTDAGRPNPIVALSDAVVRLQQRRDSLSPSNGRDARGKHADRGAFRSAAGQVRTGARTTWSIGTIEGGSSVNAIPASATARFDMRSTDAAELLALEVELHRAVEDAVIAANAGIPSEHALRFAIRVIGNRPAGTLPEDARILALLRAVDRHLSLRTELRTASTDANIPLALGVEALSIGAGGEGGGIHTTAEWFDARGRDVGLRRILLLLLALADCAPVEV